MPTASDDPPRYSLANGHGQDSGRHKHNIRPQLSASLKDRIKRAGSSGRMRLFHPKSTSSLRDAGTVQIHPTTARHDTPDSIRVHSGLDDLRDLAQFDFVGTTAPPFATARDSAMRLSESEQQALSMSMQSLLNRRGRNSHVKSLQLRLDGSIEFEAITQGYHQASASVPGENTAQLSQMLSQQPVFAPVRFHEPAKRPRWPERSSSKGALSPTFPTSPTQLPDALPMDSPVSPSNPAHEEPHQQALQTPSDGSSTSPYFSATSSQNSHSREPSSDHDDVIYTHKSPTMGAVVPELTPPPSSTRLPVVGPVFSTVPPENTLLTTPPPTGQFVGFAWPGPQSESRGLRPQAVPLLERRQSSLSLDPAGQKVPRRGSSKMSDVITKTTLEVPKDTMAPESPGFPNMLAAMNFPSPPRTSISSISSMAPSICLTPSQSGKSLTVQPRTSSTNSITSPGSVASLDEMMMQPSHPSLLRTQSDYTHSVPRRSKSNASSLVNMSMDATISSNDNANVKTNEAAAVRLSSEASASQRSLYQLHSNLASPASMSMDNLYRRSVESNMTTTTDFGRLSTTTDTTNRHSVKSNLSMASSEPSCPNEDDKDVYLSRKSLAGETRPPALRSLSMPASIPLPKEGHGSPLAARRRARKEKGVDLKHQDAESTHLKVDPTGRVPLRDSEDSPVLGWFTHVGARRKASLRGRSPLVQISHASAATVSEVGDDSIVEMPSEKSSSSTSRQTGSREMPKTTTIMPPTTRPAARVTQWTISPIMTTEIEPGVEPDQPPAIQLTISPVMVVASIEPSDPPTLLEPVIPTLTISPVVVVETLAVISPPSPPPRSPLRTASMSPLQARPRSMVGNTNKIPTITVERRHSLMNKRHNHARSSMPTPPPGQMSPPRPQEKPSRSKRLSLPLQIMAPDAPPTMTVDRPSQKRRKERSSTHKVENQPRRPSEPKAIPASRRRSVILRERFQKQKLEKDKEIAELVAKTSAQALQQKNQKASADRDSPKEEIKDQWDAELRLTDEIEKRINRLERHGDAWLSVLDPLLENMNRTLNAMKKGGKGGPLLMGEFIIDMAAEARRSMLPSIRSKGDGTLPETPLFEDFDGAYLQSMTSRDERQGAQQRKRRNSAKLASMRLQLDKPTKPAPVEGQAPALADIVKSLDLDFSPLQPPNPAEPQTPRTPKEHEFEAELAIRKRIQAQETMMDELMVRWTGPPSGTEKQSADEAIRSVEATSSITSRRSSLKSLLLYADSIRATQLPSSPRRKGKDADAKRAAPLSSYWAKNNADSSKGVGKNFGTTSPVATGESRGATSSSRRRSSVDTLSLGYVENGMLNLLMQELKKNSRLSGEGIWDLEGVQ